MTAYQVMKKNITYNSQKYLPLPKESVMTDSEGKETKSGVILVTLNNIGSGKDLLGNPRMRLRMNQFRYYHKDLYIVDKIGTTVIRRNHKKDIPKINKQLLKDAPFLKYANDTSFGRISEGKKNLVYDLDEYFSLYMRYRFNRSLKSIHADFINFLSKRLMKITENFTDYKKIIYVPINEYADDPEGFGIDKKRLNDPLSFFLSTAYYSGDLFDQLPDFELLVHDITSDQCIFIEKSFLTRKNYPKLKVQLGKFRSFKYVEEVTSEEELNANTTDTVDTVKETDELSRAKKSNELTNKIARKLTMAFTGGPVDEIDLGPDYDDEPEIVDSEDINDYFDMNVNQIIEDELIESGDFNTIDPDDEEAVDAVVDKIKEKVSTEIIHKMASPKERTPKTLKLIMELQEKQSNAVQTIDDLEALKIEEEDFSPVINSINKDILKSKFVNFDKAYNEKMLEADLDKCFTALNDATSQVYVTEKEVVDTSDEYNQKITHIYHLKDENNKNHTVRIDIPKLFDGNKVLVNGNKKIIQKQMFLKPIAKIKSDTVLITSWYNKVTIQRTGKNINTKTTNIKKILSRNKTYNPKIGNMYIKNKAFNTSLEFDDLSRYIHKLTTKDKIICFNIQDTIDLCKEKGIKFTQNDNLLLIGINTKENTPIYINLAENESITDYLENNVLTPRDKDTLNRGKALKTNVFTKVKIFGKDVPIFYLLLYFEGITKFFELSKVKYEFHPDVHNIRSIQNFNHNTKGYIQLADGMIVWDKYPIENSILMNGQSRLDLSSYTFDELNSKEILIDVLSNFYANHNYYSVLDQFHDFMIDPKTLQILQQMKLPTTFSELLVLANQMLTTNRYVDELHPDNCRIRCTEAIAHYTYKALTDAYGTYRNTLHKKRPTSITVKPDIILKSISTERTTESTSSLNPIMEIEKDMAISPKGPGGINLDQSYTLDKRAYNPDWLGVIGISTPYDAGVGITRQMVFEPLVDSTLGYIKPPENIDSLKNTNVFTPAELLSPPGVMHDDGPRIAMSYKQSKFMMPLDEATPVVVGNKIESLVAYRLSDEFVHKAKNDGVIKEISNDFIILEYKDGTHEAIDISHKMLKNSSGGFFIESKMECKYEVGHKFKKHEIIAVDPRWFSYNKDDNGASMNIGVFCNIAVIPTFDIFEDSIPITSTLAKRLGTEVIECQRAVIGKNAKIHSFPKIGDKVHIGDALIQYDTSYDDPDVNKFLDKYADTLDAEFIEDNYSKIKADYSGEIANIEIVSAVESDELSESLRKIVEDNYKKINKRNAVLKKYKNADDNDTFACGQVISNKAEPVKTTYGKIDNMDVSDSVYIKIYIKFRNIAKKADKITAYTALKGVISDVISDDLAPYSLDRPEVKIDTLLSPLAILARKTPSIYITMFGNKYMVELTRQLREIWMEE